MNGISAAPEKRLICIKIPILHSGELSFRSPKDLKRQTLSEVPNSEIMMLSLLRKVLTVQVIFK